MPRHSDLWRVSLLEGVPDAKSATVIPEDVVLYVHREILNLAVLVVQVVLHADE